MHSPKFPHKAPHFKKILAASNLAARWKRTVRDYMRKQLVPDAVEFLDFHVQLAQRCNEIEAAICSGEYTPRLSLRLKAEKSRGLCRQIVLPSPEDALVLQILSDTLWKEIRSKAPSDKAFYAPQDQAFSKKQAALEDGDFGYGPVSAWLDFQEEILRFSRTYKFVVVTDIANYYDCILHNFLRAILSEYGLEKEHALDLLLYLLDSMLWRPDYMPNYGIGLPQIDLDAPRLLAHTHLFEIDQLFAGRTDIDFARYMDDMDFGVDSLAAAKEVLRDLDLALQTRNLRVNSGKTRILTAQEALVHFRAEDNAAFDQLRGRVEANSFLEKKAELYGRVVARAIDTGLRTDRFEGGNGDKVLKRLLGLAASLPCPVGESSFREILYRKPTLRPTLLRFWSGTKDPLSYLKIINGFLLSGEAVDDLGKVLITTSLVSAKLPARWRWGSSDCFYMAFDVIGPLSCSAAFGSFRVSQIKRHFGQKSTTPIRFGADTDFSVVLWLASTACSEAPRRLFLSKPRSGSGEGPMRFRFWNSTKDWPQMPGASTLSEISSRRQTSRSPSRYLIRSH